jgi:CRP-like cAMP-binding protein
MPVATNSFPELIMTLNNDVALFQANSLLGQFEPEALRLIAFSSEPRDFKMGTVIFKAGDHSDCGYLIISGFVTVHGDERIETVGPGTLLGETALFADTLRPVTATARDTVTVRRIPRHLIKRVLNEYPATAPQLRAYFTNHLTDLNQMLIKIDQLLPG